MLPTGGAVAYALPRPDCLCDKDPAFYESSDQVDVIVTGHAKVVKDACSWRSTPAEHDVMSGHFILNIPMEACRAENLFLYSTKLQ